MPGRHQFKSEHIDMLQTVFNNTADKAGWPVTVHPRTNMVLTFVLTILLSIPLAQVIAAAEA